MEERILFIMNPAAGQRQGKRYLADILSLFREHNYVTTVMVTRASGDATELVKRYGKEFDKIVCMGGDGTFNEVVTGMLDSDIRVPLGYIPAGSTNDFANSLKLPRNNIMKAAKLVAEGTPHGIDIGRFDGRYFAYVASFGAFTKASYATPQNVKNSLGHLGYILTGIGDLMSIRPLHMRFELADKTLEGDYLFGAICNSTSLGGILTLNPNVVDMNDGLFELLLVKAPANVNELNEIVLALTTQNYDYPALGFYPTSSLHVFSPDELDWTLDGEHAVGRQSFEVENLHSAIQLIM